MTGRCVKIPSDSEALAKAAAEVSARASLVFGRVDTKPLRAYDCHVCRKWHLTHQPARGGAA